MGHDEDLAERIGNLRSPPNQLRLAAELLEKQHPVEALVIVRRVAAELEVSAEELVSGNERCWCCGPGCPDHYTGPLLRCGCFLLQECNGCGSLACQECKLP